MLSLQHRKLALATLVTLPMLLTSGPLEAGSGRWTSVGPPLPPGGSVLALAADPTGAVWAATEEAGIFRSTDGGETWETAATDQSVLVGHVRGLLPDPWSPGDVWIFGLRGVFHTEEAGARLVSRNQGLPASSNGRPSVRHLSADPTTPGRLFAVPEFPRPDLPAFLQLTRLFSSRDGGRSWELVSEDPGFGNTDLGPLAYDPAAPGTLYAGSEDGIFKSLDGGRSWIRASSGLPERSVTSLVLDPRGPGRLWAAVFGQIFHTTNGGTTWTATSEPIGGIPILTVAPSRPATLYARQSLDRDRIFRSTDGGATWQILPLGLPEPDASRVEGLAVDPRSADTVYVGIRHSLLPGEADGVLKTTDGGTSWQRKVQGLTATLARVRDLEMDPGAPGTLYAVLERRGIFKTTDGGMSWQPLPNPIDEPPLVQSLAVHPTQPGRLLLAVADSDLAVRLFSSSDGGATWQALDPTQVCLLAGLPFSLHTAFDPADPGTLYVGSGLFCRSTNEGRTWNANLGPPLFLWALELTAAPPTGLYAGGTDTLMPQRPGSPLPQALLALSTDQGSTWTRIDAGLETLQQVTHITLDPADRQHLFIDDGFRGRESTDGGITWNPVGPELGGLVPLALAMAPDDPQVRYAATREGLFRSLDGGTTWTLRSQGLAGTTTTRLLLAPGLPRSLWLGTEAGVFTLTEGCRESPTTLCLAGGRFAVEVSWATSLGTRGAGQARELTADTGWFWFFDPANVELVVKVLDACSFTDEFWIFAGGLTDVEVDLTVTDAEDGLSKTYRNSQKTRFLPIQDTNTFSTCP